MTDGYRTGSPARATASNGTPLGPRVRRPGWSGWWTYALDGSLVPDGHVEPRDPNERRERQESMRTDDASVLESRSRIQRRSLANIGRAPTVAESSRRGAFVMEDSDP